MTRVHERLDSPSLFCILHVRRKFIDFLAQACNDARRETIRQTVGDELKNGGKIRMGKETATVPSTMRTDNPGTAEHLLGMIC